MLGLTEHNPSAVEKAHELYRLGWTREALSKWVDPVDGTTHTLEEAYARQTLRGYGTVVGVSHCTTPNIQFIAKGSPAAAHFRAGTHKWEHQGDCCSTMGKPTPRYVVPIVGADGKVGYLLSKRHPSEFIPRPSLWRRALSWVRRLFRRPMPEAAGGDAIKHPVEQTFVYGSAERYHGYDGPDGYLRGRGWKKVWRMEWHFNGGRWSRVKRVRWDDPLAPDGMGWPMATAVDMQRRRDLAEAESLRKDGEAQLREDREQHDRQPGQFDSLAVHGRLAQEQYLRALCGQIALELSQEFAIETCEHGHTFAKFPDHPLREGRARCPHCMAIGLDNLFAEQVLNGNTLIDVPPLAARLAEHAEDPAVQEDERLYIRSLRERILKQGGVEGCAGMGSLDMGRVAEELRKIEGRSQGLQSAR